MLQGSGEWCEQVLGQRIEEQPSYQVDVTGSGFVDGLPPTRGEGDIGDPAVTDAGPSFGQTACLHAPQLM